MEKTGGLEGLTALLGLDEFEVVDCRQDRAAQVIRFTVVPKVREGLCPHCRTLCVKPHSTGDHDVLDLPLLECRTELLVRAPPYRCDTCRRFFTPHYAAIAEGMHATVRLLERMGQLVKHGDVAAAAAFFRIPEKTAERWYYEYAGHHRAARSPVKPITCLGIDELSVKKRHRQFACPLIDHTNARVLDVLEHRTKDAVIQWLRAGQQSGLLADLKEVTMDMWGPYADAVREVFGDTVRIVVDRFHLIQNLQACLAEGRRQIQRGLSKEAARDLKGTRWLWAKNPDHLTPEERVRLDVLQQQYPALAQLIEQREALRRILDDATIRTVEEGRSRLLGWCEHVGQLGITALETFTQTVRNWIDEIANYFVSRSTNARTEGFNHGIRTILWRAFGIPNFAHLRLRVLHAFG